MAEDREIPLPITAPAPDLVIPKPVPPPEAKFPEDTPTKFKVSASHLVEGIRQTVTLEVTAKNHAVAHQEAMKACKDKKYQDPLIETIIQE